MIYAIAGILCIVFVGFVIFLTPERHIDVEPLESFNEDVVALWNFKSPWNCSGDDYFWVELPPQTSTHFLTINNSGIFITEDEVQDK